MTIYTVALAKGGSTKTTTAAEIVAILAGRGRRVLALDLDQQGQLSTRLGVTPQTEVAAVAADVMTAEATAQEAAIEAPTVPGAHVIVGTTQLAQIEHKPEAATALVTYLPTLGEWDDVVIDTPPALGVLTLAALAAADVIVAPVPCEIESYDQLRRLAKFVDGPVSRLRPGRRIGAVVPTKHDSRRRLDQEVVEGLHRHFGDRVTTPVRETVAARESFMERKPVGLYDPRCTAAVDYAKALADVLTTPEA